MRILISGSSGLIGSVLVEALSAGGHRIGRLVRPGADRGEDDAAWEPAAGRIDAGALEGFDAVVHLAGEPIAGRWTAEKKRRIRDSRVVGTSLLCRTLSGLSHPPDVLACASAVGYYGSRGDEVLAEDAPPGTGFLPEVCVEWENATALASQAQIRVVSLRTAMVLSTAGGALKKMLAPFRLGLGGRIGSGEQYWSWITLADAVAAVGHVLAEKSLHGPVNLASPNPVTNRQFARALGRVLGRPALVPLPGFAARLLLGEMVDGMLLASARVEPGQLLASGFDFTDPLLAEALGRLLHSETI